MHKHFKIKHTEEIKEIELTKLNPVQTGTFLSSLSKDKVQGITQLVALSFNANFIDLAMK